MIVRIKTKTGILPAYETPGSAGMDLRACLSDAVELMPGQRALIPTGLFLELPQGYEAQVRARSGLAVRQGIGLVNGVGTVDSDYRGEICVPMINWGDKLFRVENGERIAQLVIARYERIQWEEAESLGDTLRGDGGFGHTGKE